MPKKTLYIIGGHAVAWLFEREQALAVINTARAMWSPNTGEDTKLGSE